MIPINIVPIKNGINFRDLGGIKTQDKRIIRSGKLFRSGAFSDITAQEKTFLSDLIHLDIILDYRDLSEINAHPDNIWAKSTYINIPANPLNSELTADISDDSLRLTHQLLKRLNPVEFMVKLYQLLPFENVAYKKLVDLLLTSEGRSIVQHCAIGKDRTGVGVALLLTILGVDEDTIMEDYQLTNKTLADYREKIFQHNINRLNEHELMQRKSLFDAKPEYLLAAFDAIKQKYGSLEQWLIKEYQLTDEKREIICDYYLT